MARNQRQRSYTEGMIQARKAVAEENREKVRVALQGMRHRNTPPEHITIKAVAEESGVSEATIYRRADLFGLVKRSNPRLQRREAEQRYHDEIARLRQEVETQRHDVDYHKQAASLTRIGGQGLVEENRLLRKQKADLQREIARLNALLDTCTCGAKERVHRLDTH